MDKTDKRILFSQMEEFETVRQRMTQQAVVKPKVKTKLANTEREERFSVAEEILSLDNEFEFPAQTPKGAGGPVAVATAMPGGAEDEEIPEEYRLLPNETIDDLHRMMLRTFYGININDVLDRDDNFKFYDEAQAGVLQVEPAAVPEPTPSASSQNQPIFENVIEQPIPNNEMEQSVPENVNQPPISPSETVIEKPVDPQQSPFTIRKWKADREKTKMLQEAEKIQFFSSPVRTRRQLRSMEEALLNHTLMESRKSVADNELVRKHEKKIHSDKSPELKNRHEKKIDSDKSSKRCDIVVSRRSRSHSPVPKRKKLEATPLAATSKTPGPYTKVKGWKVGMKLRSRTSSFGQENSNDNIENKRDGERKKKSGSRERLCVEREPLRLKQKSTVVASPPPKSEAETGQREKRLRKSIARYGNEV